MRATAFGAPVVPDVKHSMATHPGAVARLSGALVWLETRSSADTEFDSSPLLPTKTLPTSGPARRARQCPPKHARSEDTSAQLTEAHGCSNAVAGAHEVHEARVLLIVDQQPRLTPAHGPTRFLFYPGKPNF